MTRDLLKKNFPELAEDGALEICIIKVRLEPRSLRIGAPFPNRDPGEILRCECAEKRREASPRGALRRLPRASNSR